MTLATLDEVLRTGSPAPTACPPLKTATVPRR